MHHLPDALNSLASYNQFILWTIIERNGKQIKVPINYKTAQVTDAHNPDAWIDVNTAIITAKLYGNNYDVGFVFTKDDPFFFVDIDHCLTDDGAWSDTANNVLSYFPGAAVEVSQSGTGLHIIGQGSAPDHACKNIQFGLEFYTEKRFIALTGNNIIGDAETDHTVMLQEFTNNLFPPKTIITPETWTTEPVPEWNGTNDDNELIKKALASTSARAVFGGSASFADLWNANESVLAQAYTPDVNDSNSYDESSADQALIQHLAFWTGNNCERIAKLMWQSGLVRDKWTARVHKNYLANSIMRGVSMQTSVYTGGKKDIDDSIAVEYDAPTLKGSPAAKDWAKNIRAQKLIDCINNVELITKLCIRRGPTCEASFWIDNKDKTPQQLIEIITPVQNSINPLGSMAGPERLTGLQLLGYDQQIEHFKGCVYVQDLHRVFTPCGSFLKSEQFNATYGGYTFIMDDGTGKKETRKAWEAFTESQLIRYPKAQTSVFKPDLPPGQFINDNGYISINTYTPIVTPQIQGDITPFITHLNKILPNENDRAILLAYMAACIQHKGIKFQWAPLLQGMEGNGKSLFTRCVAFAIGERYTHMPPAEQISEKYNDWLHETLFIGVEDIYIPEHKREIINILRPMITGERQAIRAMQVSQVMRAICCNFIFNSNYKDAVRKTRGDRRWCVFYTAQQSPDDLKRDGMDGDYFPNLYAWLKGAGPYEQYGLNYGYAVVNNYLSTYAIPNALNPATLLHRAPTTTSTNDAINASLGAIEQEILEAIEQGRPGFAGGWISSIALENLLEKLRATRQIPQNKRREILADLNYIYHPALKHGRVNNHIPIDQGKPRLYIKCDHIHMNLTTGAEVAKAYQDAQSGPITSNVHATTVFGAR